MITLELSEDEALVLFEWLSRFEDGRDESVPITADVLIAWSLQTQLEKCLNEPFEGNYSHRVARARSRIEASWSGKI